MIEFFVSCVPPKTTAQQVGIFKRGDGTMFIAKKGKAEQAKQTLIAVFTPYKPQRALSGPVRLSITLEWPWRASESKRTRQSGRIWHTSRPDADNLAKMIQDCLAKLCFIENDAVVSELTVRKFWGDRPGITIQLAELERVAKGMGVE